LLSGVHTPILPPSGSLGPRCAPVVLVVVRLPWPLSWLQITALPNTGLLTCASSPLSYFGFSTRPLLPFALIRRRLCGPDFLYHHAGNAQLHIVPVLERIYRHKNAIHCDLTRQPKPEPNHAVHSFHRASPQHAASTQHQLLHNSLRCRLCQPVLAVVVII